MKFQESFKSLAYAVGGQLEACSRSSKALFRHAKAFSWRFLTCFGESFLKQTKVRAVLEVIRQQLQGSSHT